MCGIITDFKVRQSKRGNRFATFRLEDFTGSGECVVFPKTYEDYREILRNDAIVTVTGKAEDNVNSIKLIADGIKPLFKTGKKDSPAKVTININSKNVSIEKIREISKLTAGEHGETSIYINLQNGNKTSVMELQNIKIHYDTYTEQILSEIFGKENIILN
jgi:DNA polymerase-3 subunit alpha